MGIKGLSRIVKAAFKPHAKQINFLRNATNLTGKKLAYAYVGATAATPVFIAATTSGDGSKRAVKNSIIGGAMFGPAGSAAAGIFTLDHETNKIEQRMREEYEEDNYFEYMYNNDEDFRREYEAERLRERNEENS